MRTPTSRNRAKRLKFTAAVINKRISTKVYEGDDFYRSVSFSVISNGDRVRFPCKMLNRRPYSDRNVKKDEADGNDCGINDNNEKKKNFLFSKRVPENAMPFYNT